MCAWATLRDVRIAILGDTKGTSLGRGRCFNVQFAVPPRLAFACLHTPHARFNHSRRRGTFRMTIVAAISRSGPSPNTQEQRHGLEQNDFRRRPLRRRCTARTPAIPRHLSLGGELLLKQLRQGNKLNRVQRRESIVSGCHGRWRAHETIVHWHNARGVLERPRPLTKLREQSQSSREPCVSGARVAPILAVVSPSRTKAAL